MEKRILIWKNKAYCMVMQSNPENLNSLGTNKSHLWMKYASPCFLYKSAKWLQGVFFPVHTGISKIKKNHSYLFSVFYVQLIKHKWI